MYLFSDGINLALSEGGLPESDSTVCPNLQTVFKGSRKGDEINVEIGYGDEVEVFVASLSNIHCSKSIFCHKIDFEGKTLTLICRKKVTLKRDF